MTEIVLCNQPVKSDLLEEQCSVNGNTVVGFSNSKPSILAPYTPYLVGPNPSTIDKSVLNQIIPVSKDLTNLSLSFGGDNVVTLSDLTAKLQAYNIEAIGTSTSVYANRVSGFAGAVKIYQDALLEYRKTINGTPPNKTIAKQKAHTAFQNMQRSFRNELDIVTAQSRTRKGSPLTSPTRATNIARSSRNIAKLNIINQVQANNLIKFSKYAKFLGNGLAVIDFGIRVGNIHNSYQTGGNWERELFIESSSFALSVGSGIVAVNTGIAALGFLIVATPIGWVGLIMGGIAVAGAAAAVSMGVNGAIQENSGSWYDSLMISLDIK